MPVLAFAEPGLHLVRWNRAMARMQTDTAPDGDRLLTCSWGDGTPTTEVQSRSGPNGHLLEHDFADEGLYRVTFTLLDARRHRLARVDRYLAVVSSAPSAIAIATGAAVERFDGFSDSDAEEAQVGMRLPLDNGSIAGGELAVLIGETELRSVNVDWSYRTSAAVHFGGLGLVEAVWPCRFRGRLSVEPQPHVYLSLYLGSQPNGPQGPDIVLRSESNGIVTGVWKTV